MNPWNNFVSWIVRIEGCMDAWAATKLSAEEYADAVRLDRQIKANFARYLAYFAVASVVLALFALAIFPALGVGKALFWSALGLAYIAVCLTSAWYGYRKWANRPWWKIIGTIVLLMILAFAVGSMVASVTTGKSFAEMNWEKLQRGLAVALFLGIGLAGFLITIANLRKRELQQKAARLEAEAERERLARHSIQAELKLLQAQIEPHFLFNTLANLRYLVQSGSPDAITMLDHLIKYLRTTLPEIRAEGSTLGREAELVRAYLEIIKLRMGGALAFSIDVPADLASHSFPPLMLITLVENAVKHGIAPGGKGSVAIRVARSGEVLRIEVEDDGKGLSEPIGRGVGLANVRERLQALFGDGARLLLSGRDTAGTVALIEVPA